MANKKDFLKQFDQLAALYPVQGNARAVIHNGLDFPTSRTEYWKYTRVAPILAGSYQQHEPNISSIDAFTIEGLDATKLVFVNGHFSESLSDTIDQSGVTISSMRTVDGDRKKEMLDHLDQSVDSKTQPFNAFNTGYFQDGAYLTVDANTEVQKPILILHIAQGEQQATNFRTLTRVGANAKLQLITRYVGLENVGSFTNVVNELELSDGAKAELYLVEDEGDQTSMITNTEITQERSSHAKVVTVTESGALVRNNLNFAVNGEGCESDMYGIYFTDGSQHVDNHTRVDHKVPNCNSNELYKGVMTDRSTGVFNGKIMVHRDAQQTNAFQSNQNILLSGRASINTKPELEIYADDVKCSHGCTIGQLDEEALFYLQSRGLGKLAATKLLVQAFAGEVIEQIEIDAVKDAVEAFIHQKFQDLNA